MIQSMTGFGKAMRNVAGGQVNIEIRSLNSKSFELSLRIPSCYRHKEQEIRNTIAQKLERGKIDVVIILENSAKNKTGTFNRKLIKSYIAELKLVSKENNLSQNDLLKIALSLPNSLNPEKEAASESEWKQVDALLKTAITDFISFRNKEGKALEKDLFQHLKCIGDLLKEIEKFEPGRLVNTRQRLQKLLSGQDDVQVDQNRFEQELIYYIEKTDISEEKVRLKSHCDYFLESMKSKDSNGKKLGFITQEMGREINTIGSKANDANIQRYVVEMKDELEKIKEQIANIL